MSSTTYATTTASKAATPSVQRANPINSSREGKELMVELNFKWDAACSLLRRLGNGTIYLEDSVVRDLAAYSSTAEEVSIGIYFPKASSAEPLLKSKIPELFNRIVDTLNGFSSIRSIRVAFTLDSATFDSEWQLIKNAVYFYDLSFKDWYLWVKFLGQTKTKTVNRVPVKVQGKKVQIPCEFAQVCEGSKIERRLGGHVRVLQEIEAKKAAAKEAGKKAFFVAKAKKEREEAKVSFIVIR